MKRFFIKILSFVMVLFVLMIVSDMLLCKGLLQSETSTFQDYHAMLEGGMENDILVIGSSRARNHFDTGLIDSALNVQSFNIGIGGHPINAELLKCYLYRLHNKKPAVIIFDVNNGTLSCENDIRRSFESEQFFPLVYDRGMRPLMRDLGYGFPELNIPLYRFYGYHDVIIRGFCEVTHIKHFVEDPSYKGYVPISGSYDGTVVRGMDVQSASFSNEAKMCFESFLAQCQSDSINVVLVYSPFYKDGQEKFLGVDELRQYYVVTAKKFGCSYLDYMECDISSDSTFFYNASHMNALGAKVFGNILCNDLKSLSYPFPDEIGFIGND